MEQVGYIRLLCSATRNNHGFNSWLKHKIWLSSYPSAASPKISSSMHARSYMTNPNGRLLYMPNASTMKHSQTLRQLCFLQDQIQQNLSQRSTSTFTQNILKKGDPPRGVPHLAPLARSVYTGTNDGSWKDSICISVDCEEESAPPDNVEDVLFDMFKDEMEEKVHMGKFIAALNETGLRRTDPRLKEMRDNLMEVHAILEHPQVSSVTSLHLDREAFKKVIGDNIVLISRALRHQFVIPEWTDFCSHIEDFYYTCKPLQGGHVATYIPQLAKFSPEYWGVAVCTTDGQRYFMGDTTVNFTMQSCSKPITYGIALNELGNDTVHKHIGQEPSGRMFNAIVLDYNNKPHNPLVNAGSIAVNALLHTLVHPDMSSSEKFDFVQHYFRRMAGSENVGFSNGTFLSERENADRNYALGYYMRENKCYPDKTDLMASLDLYFQCCSMEVNAESVSVMAATLANGGICPTTGDQVLMPPAVRDVLSLMHSCGMYDYSGQFAFQVGLPAKSGVCGAIMLVIPNVMGICTYSPALDGLGNSVRGIKFCQEMVEVFNFHRYDNLRHAANKKDPRKQKYESRGQKITSLLFSASAGDVTAMRRYFLSGVNMNECDYDGRCPLHLAAADGHMDVVRFLLDKCNVKPDPKDRWGHLPQDDADQFGHSAIAEVLKKHTKVTKEKQEKRRLEEERRREEDTIKEEDENEFDKEG